MQQLKTITKTKTTKTASVHVDTVYCVIQNCFNNLQVLEADCTSASYFINSANIFAQLNTLIFLLFFFEGMVSETINSSKREFSIFS